MKHYRVDKMLSITLTGEKRAPEGRAAFAAVDMSTYTKKVFGFGTDAEITAPADVRKKAADTVSSISSLYNLNL